MSLLDPPSLMLTPTVPTWAREAGAFLLSERLPRATASQDLAAAVESAYATILGEIADRKLHAIRAWNFIGSIHAPMPGGEDRYMHFNAGRVRAMRAFFGDALRDRVPAATGVGHSGESLEIHVLASPSKPIVLENPQQTPAYRYSKKYGSLPPCFSRAVVAGDELLIAGTAAITGETSQHDHDLSRQLSLTIEHLNTLLQLARQTTGVEYALRDVRAYVPSAVELSQLTPLLEASGLGSVELVSAELCRRDLLIEIEARGLPAESNS